MLLISGVCVAVVFLSPPPNRAAVVRFRDEEVALDYNNQTIFKGQFKVEGKAYVRQLVQKGDRGQVDQIFAITADSIQLTGKVNSDEDSFACSSEPEGYGKATIVRNSFGKSDNRLNRAVYERTQDWLFSIDEESAVSIRPDPKNGYNISVNGSEVIIRFRPRYFAKHRGLKYFEPWKKKVWSKSEVGWCSWFAFWDKVTQQDIHDAADVLGEKLRPYGLTTLQIDDGFQQVPVGLPDTWITANSKFPDGMTQLAKYIQSKDLTPGIWLTPMVHDEKAVLSYPDLFVKNDKGKPVDARWIGFPIDGSNPKAINTFIRPVFENYAKNGWGYFKMDALRHLRYEGYNSNAGFFAKKKYDRVEAFRNVVKAAREGIGENSFFLACWGIRPELTGIVDAVRIGGDGFGWECLAQYNSFNNVVWRNDPDHIQATAENGYRDCTITSIAGGLYMLTDTPTDLRNKDLSAIQATIPVLFTRPGQVYDVDPSRSIHLDQVDTETSGGGPRAFDASRTTTTGLFQLDVNTGWANWSLLARADERQKLIPFSDMGLKSDQKYLVYEFWTKKLVGVFTGVFEPGEIDPKYRVQLFCVRPMEDHPFFVASDRHISCGALEVKNIQWKDGVLSGDSERIPGVEYKIYVYEPEGSKFITSSGESASSGGIRTIVLPPSSEKVSHWEVRYQVSKVD